MYTLSTRLLVKQRKLESFFANIEKAFLQIALQPKERDSTRFLWLKDVNKEQTANNITTCRFTRAPFEIILSPFLLGTSIKHHFSQNKTSKNLSKGIYVHNLITESNYNEETDHLYTALKNQFGQMSMSLRDWSSICKELMKKMPESNCMKENFAKVLELQWSTVTNQLQVSINTFTRI